MEEWQKRKEGGSCEDSNLGCESQSLGCWANYTTAPKGEREGEGRQEKRSEKEAKKEERRRESLSV